MGLKFMQRGEERKKEKLKEQAKMLVGMIRDEQHEDLEEETNFVKTGNKFSKNALPVKELVIPSEDKVMKAAKQLSG